MRTRTTLVTALVLGAATATAACGEPPLDDNAPAPTGILQGSAVYFGPRPECDYDEQSGLPTRARGRAVMILFEYDNPPPPAGTATSPSNLMTIPASRFFTDLATDCLPQSPTPADLAVTIQRSIGIHWPEIALGRGTSGVDYMIQGFYDRDENFNPFFSVTLSPTAMDLAGGAVEDPLAAEPVPARISFGSAEANPNGQIVVGVTVMFAAPVNTEPPVFRFESDPLSSEQPALVSGDPALDEETNRMLTNASIVLYDDLGTPEGVTLLEALGVAGLSFDFDGPGYAIYVREVDVDGVAGPDPHPVLGPAIAGAYLWLSPIALMQRVKSELEEQAGIPDVAFLPALPKFDTLAGPGVTVGDIYTDSVPLLIPPAVAVVTRRDIPVCQIATVAPGSTAELHLGRTSDCQEIPTGRYSVNVLHGVAGGAFVENVSSPTGYDIVGGAFGGQAWTIPNELGDPAQLPSPSAGPDDPPDPDCAGDAPCTDSQGITTAFLVHDPDPATATSRIDGDQACLAGPSLFAMGNVVNYVFQDFNVPSVQAYVNANPELESTDEVRDLCCEPVAHLCGIELCEATEAFGDPGRLVRGGPTSVRRVTWTDGSERFVPDCVPFHMPTACCGE